MGNEPVEVEGRVIEADAAIGGGMVIVVALVAEDGVLAEGITFYIPGKYELLIDSLLPFPIHNRLHTPFSCFAIPQFRAGRFALQVEGGVIFFADALDVVADEDAGAAMFTEGDRAFGVPAVENINELIIQTN